MWLIGYHHCKAGGFKFLKKWADHNHVIGSATGLFIENHKAVIRKIDRNIVYRGDHTTESFISLIINDFPIAFFNVIFAAG